MRRLPIEKPDTLPEQRKFSIRFFFKDFNYNFQTNILFTAFANNWVNLFQII
jgi:hypothetical protein